MACCGHADRVSRALARLGTEDQTLEADYRREVNRCKVKCRSHFRLKFHIGAAVSERG